MKKTILFFAALFIVLLVWSQNDKSKNILDQLSKKTKAYKSISAGFTFSMNNKEMKINEKNEGTIQLKGQKYQIDLPGTGIKIYSDGKTIWNYMKKGNQVTISNLEDSGSDLMNPSSLFSIYEKGFKSKFISEKNNLYTIELIPEKGQDNVKNVKIVVDKTVMFLKSATLKGTDGNEYGINILKYETDKTIPDADFVFDPSKTKGVEVIDLR
jgi:chaperone LolA